MLNRQQFEATLQQCRDIAQTDNLGQELTHALQWSIKQQIAADNTLTPHTTVHFTMQSSAFTTPSSPSPLWYVNSKKGVKDWTCISRPWRPNSTPMRNLPDDTFPMETTFICTLGPGIGNEKDYQPSEAAVCGIVKVTRHHQEQGRPVLCSCHRHNKGFSRCQQEYPRPRLKISNKPVPSKKERPRNFTCKQASLTVLVVSPHLSNFRLPCLSTKSMSIDPPHMIIFCGPQSEKFIHVIQEDDHYDSCNSCSRFLSRSHFCDDCSQGFDHDDMAHHPCLGKWCPYCKSKDCPNFIEA